MRLFIRYNRFVPTKKRVGKRELLKYFERIFEIKLIKVFYSQQRYVVKSLSALVPMTDMSRKDIKI